MLLNFVLLVVSIALMAVFFFVQDKHGFIPESIRYRLKDGFSNVVAGACALLFLIVVIVFAFDLISSSFL